MKWDASVLRVAPEEFIVEGLSELLRKAGFREVGREYKRIGEARVAIVIGERENIFTRKETMIIAVSRGTIEGEKLKKLLGDRGESAVIIPFDGIEGTVDGVKILTLEWLADAFTRYEIKPPRTILEKFLPQEGEVDFLREFVLDGPLLNPVSPLKLIEEAKKLLSYRYGVNPELIRPEKLKLKLREVHVFTWASGGNTKRALIRKEGVVLDADSGKLKGLAMRVLLEDVATVQASELSFDRIDSPEEMLVREATKAGILDLKTVEGRRAYLPVEAVLELSIGDNRATVKFNLENGMGQARASPLREDELIRKVLTVAERETGEEPFLTGKVRKGKVLLVRGRTERYVFEGEINRYSGEIGHFRKALNEGAMLSIILERYPDGGIVGVEKRGDSVIADVLTEKALVVLRIDPETGESGEVKRLIHPFQVLGSILKGDNLPFKPEEFSLKVEGVLWHRNVRAVFEGKGVTVRAEYNGETGEIGEKEIEITREAAIRIALSRYDGFKLILDEESDGTFYLTLEGEKHLVKLRVFSDGRIEEIDRFLKKEAVEEIALRKVSEIDEGPVVESLSLRENWEVEFSGAKRFGRMVVHRTTGEVLAFENQYLESFLAKLFKELVEEEYGDEVEVEWVLHNLEEGIAGVKGYGERGTYFAKFNTHTGEVISHDFVPRGITSKIRLAQVESRYRP
ncbi:hypothetical protein A3L09_06925 [Thermococcus profundus]|uniref:Uncharacterized protein n=1 Tax=Thermococcus profundus TaxID=49899 RepID=A0A2Z2MB39_THEPR|nr:hypothetical protein [Thermococcus profundus]ASJ03006.1 hypothetical protein A3L09_06925 [Thermococcus profundus]